MTRKEKKERTDKIHRYREIMRWLTRKPDASSIDKKEILKNFYDKQSAASSKIKGAKSWKS